MRSHCETRPQRLSPFKIASFATEWMAASPDFTGLLKMTDKAVETSPRPFEELKRMRVVLGESGPGEELAN